MSTFKIQLAAGPLWNDEDAKQKAPKIAAAHQGEWDGNWRTVVPSQMSTVDIMVPVEQSGSHEFLTDVLAGPLWSNDEAQKIGPAIAASYGGEFTGQWRTITEGVMSVIQVRFKY